MNQTIPEETKKKVNQIAEKRFYRLSVMTPTQMTIVRTKHSIQFNELDYLVDCVDREYQKMINTPHFKNRQESDNHYGIFSKTWS